jgi:hypothetical protein
MIWRTTFLAITYAATITEMVVLTAVPVGSGKESWRNSVGSISNVRWYIPDLCASLLPLETHKQDFFKGEGTGIHWLIYSARFYMCCTMLTAKHAMGEEAHRCGLQAPDGYGLVKVLWVSPVTTALNPSQRAQCWSCPKGHLRIDLTHGQPMRGIPQWEPHVVCMNSQEVVRAQHGWRANSEGQSGRSQTGVTGSALQGSGTMLVARIFPGGPLEGHWGVCNSLPLTLPTRGWRSFPLPPSTGFHYEEGQGEQSSNYKFCSTPPVITATLDLFPKLPGQATVREQRQHFWKRLRFDF